MLIFGEHNFIKLHEMEKEASHLACGTFLIADFAAFYYSLLMHILCNLCQMY